MVSETFIQQIKREWERFTDSGELDPEVVRPPVAASWRRCAQLGIDPRAPKPPPKLSAPQLRELKARNRLLLETALPFMEFLCSAARGTGFILVITDAYGVVMELFGDDEVLGVARGNNYVPGSSREESLVGTNAICLALEQREPVQLTGAEHWNVRHHEWTCASAPIFGSGRELLGTVTLSGHSLHAHRHTLGMVISAAEAIHDRLCEREATQHKSRLDALLATIINSLSEAFITIDGTGLVSSVNPTAERKLGIRAEQALGKSVLRLFPSSPELIGVLEGCSKEQNPIEVVNESGRGHFIVTAYVMHADGVPQGAFLALRERKEFLNQVRDISGFDAVTRFEDIVGQSPALRRQIELARITARQNSRILITGETGTGKELFAQSIHNGSPRSRGPFVALNCAAIPRELLESELFGYKGGAFTGSRKGGQVGKLELADGGTIFLDEINQLPLDLQAKLLRVLQDSTILRLGDTKPIRVDVRVVAATNEDLHEKSLSGDFRQDLYFRLSVVEINLPPLRERIEDIPLLAAHILERLAVKLNRGPLKISPAGAELLCSYAWQGNVRELENVLEMAAIVCEGETLDPEHLAYRMKGVAQRATSAVTAPAASQAPVQAAAVAPSAPAESVSVVPIRDAEIDLIRTALKEYDCNITLVSRQLQISRSTIYRRMKEHGITKSVRLG
ncbi:MAG TPA: sigma 54-interacting transcriptional regulator [Ramlibacter sp.]|nr:sigma 54-interacting transcriptional regulator [Ramlibacter sp.]